VTRGRESSSRAPARHPRPRRRLSPAAHETPLDSERRHRPPRCAGLRARLGGEGQTVKHESLGAGDKRAAVGGAFEGRAVRASSGSRNRRAVPDVEGGANQGAAGTLEACPRRRRASSSRFAPRRRECLRQSCHSSARRSGTTFPSRAMPSTSISGPPTMKSVCTDEPLIPSSSCASRSSSEAPSTHSGEPCP
jgi:hypothetical protein